MEYHLFEFKAPNGCPSACQVEIYRSCGLVVVTDIDRGMSVTNACETIASLIVVEYELQARRIILVERYYPGEEMQTTDLVQFDIDERNKFGSPRWTHIPKRDFEQMISVAWETAEPGQGSKL